MSGKVIDAIDRAGRLLDGLLVLARSEGGVEVNEPVDLADLARAASAHVAGEADAAATKVAVEAAPAPVRGDPALLQRLVDNLLDNAVRHNHPAGG